MGTGESNAGGNPVIEQHPIQGRAEILLVTSSYSNRGKLRPDGPLGSYADFTIAVQALLLANLGKITRRMPDSSRPIRTKMASTRKYCDVSMTS